MPNALEALLSRIQHLLHFGQDPVVVIEPDNADRGLLINRLLDKLPDGQDVALLRYKKSPGMRKLRTDILSQWFSDPVINPDDTLAESYLRLSQQGAQRLLVVDGSCPLEADIFREFLALSEHTDDQMGLLVIAPDTAAVPALRWQPIWLGDIGQKETPASAEAKSKKPKPLLLIVAAALVLAVVVVATLYKGKEADTPQSVSVPLPGVTGNASPGAVALTPQPVQNSTSVPNATHIDPESEKPAAPPHMNAEQRKDMAEARADIIHVDANSTPATEPAATTPTASEQQAEAETADPQPKPQVAQQPKPEPKPEPAKPAPAKADPKNDAWPAGIPDSHYALQLIAGQDQGKVQAAMAGQGVSDWQLVKTRRNGQDFYLVVQGNYANLDAAKAAVAKLPATFRKAGAWPKRYDKIKAEIKAGKG
ncbi:SPOR domain-containing protein [Gallaecimonas pentaromativorans]|uniref:SPOR domain-containing protein n=1 Tax=Gallaecimonas pentaromativorans TaxID=584787 RepID=UPI003A94C6B9